ncbi:uncharacterized protein SETTUDRAFT_40243 [Exserohilum turcica Et28A]|uniref:protein S-acyltransferase n=1 Tax=Exserohilum turcicum (strain 28A) TaxID=671987 RepID=R0ILC8_EXST2|nr:uncharacterized protein SETTUDRAFT_40243 [Exserohilum turcica Et28A]EOA85606.1 hypothetical protein SETTUDRAFT_40243 [Exserohilum turcica Et28A]
MCEDALNHEISSTGFQILPNENLVEIASFLNILDLRVLSKVSRRLYYFVQDYFKRYRYNAAIWTMPNEILFEVVQHLDWQKDQICFAQSSRRFYPVIADYISRHNVRCNRSSLLNYAAKRNLTAMTQRILQVGGDIETRLTIPWTANDKHLTPLATAARHGHLGIVKILLEAGANQFIDGLRVPLLVAIFARHESVALLLSQQLCASVEPLGKSAGTVLQIASQVKLPRLVKHYLNDRDVQLQRRLDVKHVHNLSNALVRVLLVDFSDADLLKRKLDDDAYRIVFMLLQQGASPDIRIQTQSSPVITARVIASRHPDPRIRNLLSAKMPVTTLVNTRPVVGRLWMASSGTETPTSFTSQSHVLLSASSSSADLLGALKRLKSMGMVSMDVGEFVWRRTKGQILLNASDIAQMVHRENCKSKKSLDLHSLELNTECSFPQLACPRTDVQSAAREFWARIPVVNSCNADPRPMLHTRNVCPVPQTARRLAKASCVDSFPQLTQVGPRSNDVAQDNWASFLEREVFRHTKEPHAASPDQGVNQATKQLRMSRKQSKWMPLAF